MEETIFEQTYTPDWANIPAGFDWVAVDSDGGVWAYEKKPFQSSFVWLSEDESNYRHLGFVDDANEDTWIKMLYQRPNNNAT